MDEKKRFVDAFVSGQLARVLFRPRYKGEGQADYMRARSQVFAAAKGRLEEQAGMAWKDHLARRGLVAKRAVKGKPSARRAPRA